MDRASVARRASPVASVAALAVSTSLLVATPATAQSPPTHAADPLTSPAAGVALRADESELHVDRLNERETVVQFDVPGVPPCWAPCVVRMRSGRHDVTVREPFWLRRMLTIPPGPVSLELRAATPAWRVPAALLLVTGGLGTPVGMSVLFAGVGLSWGWGPSPANPTLLTAGGLVTVVSLLMVTVGIPLLVFSRPSVRAERREADDDGRVTPRRAPPQGPFTGVGNVVDARRPHEGAPAWIAVGMAF